MSKSNFAEVRQRKVGVPALLLLAILGFGSGVLPALAASITVGVTNILATLDSDNANLLLAQEAKLSQTATIQSLSFYVTRAAGNLRLGIYDATGPGGGPGALQAQTNSFTPVVGWNTANVISPISLSAGIYWLAYIPSSNDLYFQLGPGNARYYSFRFGVMPATFSKSPSSGNWQWSFYATLNTAASFNFALGNGGSASVTQGSSTTNTITATLSSGTTQAVSFTAAGLPTGATATFNPASCSPACGTTMTITTAASTPVGNSTITVTGTAGTLTQTTTFVLTVKNPPPSGTPTMIQHVSTASNWDPDSGNPGNPYYISLPNEAGAGNAIVLGISYPFAAGRTVTVSDDKSNTWTLGATTPTSPATGQIVSSLYYALNVASGTQKITVTFDAALFNFQAVVSEFYNVATVAAIDGNSGNAAMAAPTVTAGSFTPETAGDLIYSYGFDIGNTSATTGFTAGSGFTLLSADVVIGSVAQYAIQASAGSIDPTVTATGSTDPFNAVGIALKPAAAGTPPAPGIRIVHVYHVLYPGAVPLEFPSSGNLLVCVTSFTSYQMDVSAVSTNPSNTWTKALVPDQSDFPQIWYAENATTSPSLNITPIIPSKNGDSVTFLFFDVTGAASSPYDATAGLPTAGASNTNNANLIDFPVITPSTSNGLIFAVMNDGIGPTTGMVGAGFTLDSVTYGNEIDADQIDNADGYAHYYNASTAPVAFGWVMHSSQLPEWSAAVAIAFMGAGSP